MTGLAEVTGAAAVNADCLKLTSYFGERQRTGNAFVADALLNLYGHHEIATSILLRGIEGFGAKHHRRTDTSLTLSEDLPLVAVAVDARPRIEAVLPEAARLTESDAIHLQVKDVAASVSAVASPVADADIGAFRAVDRPDGRAHDRQIKCLLHAAGFRAFPAPGRWGRRTDV